MATKVPPTSSSHMEPHPGAKFNSASADTSFFSMSTLASMSVTVGIGFFRCVCFLIVQSFNLISHYTGKKSAFEYQSPRFEKKDYDLRRYDDFAECFEKDPIQGLNKLLDFLDKRPANFKTIILDIIKKTEKPSSEKIIMKMDDVFFGLLASPEVLFHRERVIMGNYSDKEMFWLTGNHGTWDPKGKAPCVVAAHQLQEEYDDTKKACETIWKNCLVHLKVCTRIAFSEKYSLGQFMSWLHGKNNFQDLTAREDLFDPLMTNIIQALAYLNNEPKLALKSYPEFQKLVKKAHQFLLKKKNQNTVFDLVQAIISWQCPSPKKRRPNRH